MSNYTVKAIPTLPTDNNNIEGYDIVNRLEENLQKFFSHIPLKEQFLRHKIELQNNQPVQQYTLNKRTFLVGCLS